MAEAGSEVMIAGPYIVEQKPEKDHSIKHQVMHEKDVPNRRILWPTSRCYGGAVVHRLRVGDSDEVG